MNCGVGPRLFWKDLKEAAGDCGGRSACHTSDAMSSERAYASIQSPLESSTASRTILASAMSPERGITSRKFPVESCIYASAATSSGSLPTALSKVLRNRPCAAI
jgi:hypothetical protein